MSFCWDLALPSDAPEMEFLRESDKYRIHYYTDRYGDTIYQGQLKLKTWWDDSDAVFYDEDDAIAWFEDQVSPSNEEGE